MPEDMSEYMPEDMSDRMPEDMSEYMPEDMPDRMPEDMSDRVPEDMPDRMPEDLPDRMPEDMPEDMPDHMPEDMPDRMSNRMSEDMSDRMPEDLPVRKCINVMVGITRSKVICLGPKTPWRSANALASHKHLYTNLSESRPTVTGYDIQNAPHPTLKLSLNPPLQNDSSHWVWKMTHLVRWCFSYCPNTVLKLGLSIDIGQITIWLWLT